MRKTLQLQLRVFLARHSPKTTPDDRRNSAKNAAALLLNAQQNLTIPEFEANVRKQMQVVKLRNLVLEIKHGKLLKSKEYTTGVKRLAAIAKYRRGRA